MTELFGESLCGLMPAGRHRVRSRCGSSSRAAQLSGARASERCQEPSAGDERGQAFGVLGWSGGGMRAGSTFVHGMVKPNGAPVSLGGQIVDGERGREHRASLSSTECSVL